MKAVEIPEIFGKSVFNDRVMKERLPEKDYIAVRRAIEFGEPLTHDTAKVVASAMKEWAIENGVLRKRR